MARFATLLGLKRRPVRDADLAYLRRVQLAEIRALLCEIAERPALPPVRPRSPRSH